MLGAGVGADPLAAGVISVAVAGFISFTPKMEEEESVELVGRRLPRIGREG